MAVPTRLRFCVLRADQAGFAAWLAAAAWCPPTLGQSTPLPSERTPPQAVRLVSSGVEIAVGSGHADRGAYFGEAGIESAGRLSPVLDLGASLGGGWASSRFNDAYAGLARSAFDRISVQGWLTAHVSPHGYLSPHLEFSTIVDPGVRAALSRPSFLLVGLTTGVEF